MRQIDSNTNSMDMNVSKLQETVKDGYPGVLQFMGWQRIGRDLASEHKKQWRSDACTRPMDPFHTYAFVCSSQMQGASHVALVVKNLPAKAGDLRDVVQSLGREDPLRQEMANHYSILAWRIPWTEESCGLQSIGSQRVGGTRLKQFSTQKGRVRKKNIFFLFMGLKENHIKI